ncbi:MAG TPA: hypothetical protein VFE60_12050 [Roseiarcus sp.]|jgi:hypothetical protein|nr:hypothetical protein [Roseiarcus sp.]
MPVGADFLVELRGFEPLTSAAQAPARLTGSSLPFLGGSSATFDRRFDEGGGKEGERDGSADPTFGFAFARGKRFDGLVGNGGQFVEPMMSVAKCVSEDRAHFCSHRARGGGSFALALDDLAEAPIPRRTFLRSCCMFLAVFNGENGSFGETQLI